MSNTLTAHYVTRLPENTSRARELQWCMEHYHNELISARSQREEIWRMYDAAIDRGESKGLIDELGVMAEMFDNIADEAWRDWNEAQADYLRIFN